MYAAIIRSGHSVFCRLKLDKNYNIMQSFNLNIQSQRFKDTEGQIKSG